MKHIIDVSYGCEPFYCKSTEIDYPQEQRRFMHLKGLLPIWKVPELTPLLHIGQVCSEETLNEILQRYLRYNMHAASYTWKHNGVNLDMSKTLSENDIVDEDEEFYNGRMDRDHFSQSICLYFNDDLTEL